jgi:RNase P subunit RPR2
MEERKPICPKCNGAMVKGLQLDIAHGNTPHQSEWMEGDPEPNRRKLFGVLPITLPGVKADAHIHYAITSYRCEKCGYLESYAD